MGTNRCDDHANFVDFGARLDRDFEREGLFAGPAVELSPHGSLQQLIRQRHTAGVLQPLLPRPEEDDGEEDTVVRQVPLDARFDFGAEEDTAEFRS